MVAILTSLAAVTVGVRIRVQENSGNYYLDCLGQRTMQRTEEYSVTTCMSMKNNIYMENALPDDFTRGALPIIKKTSFQLL